MPKPVLDFWFDFASVYSFLSATRIAPLADAAGVSVRWQPFLLGPIFASQGMKDSPFNLFPVKGQHMIRDVQRTADEIGVGDASHLGKLFRQLKAQRMFPVVAIAQMSLVYSLNNLRVTVAQWVSGPAILKIYITVAIQVPDIVPLGTAHNHLGRRDKASCSRSLCCTLITQAVTKQAYARLQFLAT